MASQLAGAAKAASNGSVSMDSPTIPRSSVQGAPLPAGLTSDEARRRLEKFGPNAVPDTGMHPLRRALTKFWAPVSWMLEAAIRGLGFQIRESERQVHLRVRQFVHGVASPSFRDTGHRYCASARRSSRTGKSSL